MKHNYTALDSAILEALKSGPKKFRELETTPEIKRQSIKIAAAHNADVKHELEQMSGWTFIAKRLESFEARGIVAFTSGSVGWSLKEQA